MPVGPLAARTPEHAAGQCGDVLAQMRLKPREVRYTGCVALADRQGKPLRATYRVPGRHAARAERFFVQAVGMHRLRRSCCHWDAPPHRFRGADKRQYGITMVSEETGARTRAAWPGIPMFEITIESLMEDP